MQQGEKQGRKAGKQCKEKFGTPSLCSSKEKSQNNLAVRNSKSKGMPDIGEVYVNPQDSNSEKTNDDKEMAISKQTFYISLHG